MPKGITRQERPMKRQFSIVIAEDYTILREGLNAFSLLSLISRLSVKLGMALRRSVVFRNALRILL
jgi:hypothetical protein